MYHKFVRWVNQLTIGSLVASQICISCIPFRILNSSLLRTTPEISGSNTSPMPVKPEKTLTPRADILKGIGILGDSVYDEYQADDHRGGIYSQVTFNLVEILHKNRDFNFGPWGTWGEPRRTGFEYNWARSGATSTTMIEQGQHTGLAQQVKDGKVTFVFIGIGGNDFSPYYIFDFQKIYNGEMTDEQVQQKVNNAISNVTLAVETVKTAGAQGIMVTTFTRWDLDLLVQADFPDPIKRKRVADAIIQVNEGIKSMAEAQNVILIDQENVPADYLARFINGYFYVGGVPIDYQHNDNEPHHVKLGDNQHVGTVGSGFMANLFFITPLNAYFGTNIQPLTDTEILANAGLSPVDIPKSFRTMMPILFFK